MFHRVEIMLGVGLMFGNDWWGTAIVRIWYLLTL